MESRHLQDGPGFKARENQHRNVSTTKVRKDPPALNAMMSQLNTQLGGGGSVQELQHDTELSGIVSKL
jgi:hypothetical protein